jgi:translocation and assembly module TamB
VTAHSTRKILLWSGGSLGALLLLTCALVAWLLSTTSGARWAARVVTSRFAPQVRYASIDGTIAGELTVAGFEFDGGADKARIRIRSMRIDPTLMMLFSRVLRIDNARVQGLAVVLPPKKVPPDPDEPLWIEPPLEVSVRNFTLAGAAIYRGKEKLATLEEVGLSAEWKTRELILDSLTVRPGDIQGGLAVSGRVTPEGDTLRGALKVQWRDVLVPESLAGRVLASRGALTLNGTPKDYAATGELDAGPPNELTHVVLDVTGTDHLVNLKQLQLRQRAGEFALNGVLRFDPQIGWDVKAVAREFNPGELLANWQGRVNLDVASEGKLAEAGPSGTLHIASLSGELRGRPVAGNGDIEFAAPSRFTGDLRVASGKSRVTVKGSSASRNQVDAAVELAVASLGDWVPDSQGSLTGSFTVRGVWPKLTIDGAADGKSLALGENQVSKVHVDATIASPLDPDGKVHAVATQVTLAGQVFREISLDASGDQAKHRAEVTAHSELFEGTIALAGGLTRAGWNGELTKLDFSATDIAHLSLREPSRIAYESGGFSLAQTCVEQKPTVLCSAVKLEASGALDAGYSFERVPLKIANTLAPQALAGELQGEVQGHGRVRRDHDGQWLGDLAVTSESARLVLAAGEEKVAPLATQGALLIYENLDMKADFAGMKATARLTAKLEHGGSVDASMVASDLNAPAAKLAGKINATMPTLAPFGAFVPTVANLDGTVNAHIVVGGTSVKPEFTGNIDATRLQADLGKLGIELRDGSVRGEARREGGFELAGEVGSGKGRLNIDGDMDERGSVDLRIRGENFVAADIPAANVIVTPDLALTGNSKAYLLKGDVTIPSATINLQKLPKDSPPGVSPDVVVIRNGHEVEHAAVSSGFPLTAMITVKLGDKIAVTGFGMDATVAGQLGVREAPGAATTGSGQLTVVGRYKAYGQDLTIKDGRLLFAGTPLDNPRLSIVATREIRSDLKTGLQIAGSAQRPIVTVISDPNVGEADALSYLVTGRSLSEVGSASASSQNALASATQSLEGAAGGLVAKRIGKRLGLDEAGVEENELIGGSALTIGEYLSPRLYLSYGVGLFEPGEVIALRYKMSKDVGVKVQRGTEETRAGIEYRIER